MFQLKWVWKNLEGCRKRYVFALCSTAVLSMMALVNSVLTAQIMDTVFTPVKEGQGTTPELWHRLVVLVSILIGFTMFRMCFNYLSVMTYETCSQKLLFKLRRDLYANMQAQDSSFFSKNRTGDLMTRLTGDLDMVRHTTCYVIRMIIDCVVLFLTTSITFLCVDWLFALAMLAVTPIIFILTKVFAKQVHPLYVDLRERLSRMNTAAQENIAGNRVVKAFAREDYEIEQFDKKNEDYRKANLKASLLWFKFSPYIDGFSQSLSIAVLLVGGSFLIMGRIGGGDAARSFARGFAALFAGEITGVLVGGVLGALPGAFDVSAALVALAGVAVLYAYLFLFTDRDMAALSVVIAQSDRFEEACELIARTAKLSKREAEILPLALRGRTAERIAGEFFISKNTVDTHLRRIYAKCGVHTRQELIDLGERTEAEL